MRYERIQVIYWEVKVMSEVTVGQRRKATNSRTPTGCHKARKLENLSNVDRCLLHV